MEGLGVLRYLNRTQVREETNCSLRLLERGGYPVMKAAFVQKLCLGTVWMVLVRLINAGTWR